LRQDDKKEDNAREEGCDTSGERSLSTGLSNEPVCEDKLHNAEVAFCDWKNHVMELEIWYKDMATFHLVVRQFAIKNEFELGIETTSTTRYRGYCKGSDCPWRIHTRLEIDGSPTIIVSPSNTNCILCFDVSISNVLPSNML
jgi:hypothetical protein